MQHFIVEYQPATVVSNNWLITTVEAEADKDEWRALGVATAARVKRMIDSQFISELMLGFSKTALWASMRTPSVSYTQNTKTG